MQETRCAKCDAHLFEPSGVPATPCPVCGCVARSIPLRLDDGIRFNDGHRIKAYRADSSKFFLDARSGPSYYRVGAEWHHVMRVIDRENDRYTEKVRVLSTGEIIREIDESLSQHTNRGGSKNQAPR